MPQPEYEPGGLERKQCGDTRPHRAHTHTWFNDNGCGQVYEPARTVLCEGVQDRSCRSYTCNCVGGSQDRNRCEYRTLADAVIENLPTSDGDSAEVSLCVDAVDAVGEALRLFRTPPGDA
jgi:hypothetical protein